jgi:hypothetical protein
MLYMGEKEMRLKSGAGLDHTKPRSSGSDFLFI